MIAAILLVPAPGDPGGLLADGLCGADAPVVRSGHVCAYARHREWSAPSGWQDRDCYMCRHPETALPLRWDDELVSAGWDRLRRTLHRLPDATRPTGPVGLSLHEFQPMLSELEAAAEYSVRIGMASRVVRLTLDADLRFVEVP